ncbi:MAG: polysaccharide deacetylase family protein [Parcubacteria group bacterium]|nr:polysaccharide deacetylase family protein [Parcubacteria group bacterium]
MKKYSKNGALFAVLIVAAAGIYLLDKEAQPVPAAVAQKEAATEVRAASGLQPEIVRGDSSKKQVIFTFDGGASAESGEAILRALKKHGVVGTFFLTGKFAEQNPELVKKITGDRHEIFNHTYSHPDLTTLTEGEIKEEFDRADAIISGLIGKSTKPYFRPPYGARNARVVEAARESGYQSVYWTVDVLDWKESAGFTAAQAKERILKNLEPGTIYLMHIGDTITGTVLGEVLTEIESRGYAVVSLTKGI